MARYRIIIPLIAALIVPAQAGFGMLPSSKECRECHTDIFKLWSTSLHSNAYSNPSFQASFLKMQLEKGEDSGHECLQCHAPASFLGAEPGKTVSEDGIGCAFCHSISAVRQGNIDNYYVIDTTGPVYGPYNPSSTTGAHDMNYSSIHLTAELCAGCHEYKNANGVGILETFTEWKDSPYREDEVYCQNCHMPIMPELSVADGHKGSGYYVTAHEFRGGHSKINLAHAVELETTAEREGDFLHVTVSITNAESGHKLPTGIPIRKLILNVTMKSSYNVEIGSARRVYRKVLTDMYGTVIENVPDMFREATRIYADNRIAPKETRVEKFVFEVPAWAKRYAIETVLNYEYTRPILTEESITVEMARNLLGSKQIK